MSASPMRPPKTPRPVPVPRVRSSVIDGLAAGEVDAWWAGVGPLPLVSPLAGGEAVVTFCWRDATAEQVLLFANRLTDETSLADTLLERKPGTDLWHASFRMAGNWRASYCFLVQRPGTPEPWAADGHVALRQALDHGQLDPGNPARCRNRAGVEQSVVTLPDAPAQPWLEPRPGVEPGTVAEAIGPDGRDIWIYDPAGTSPDTALPLVIALDGEVWTSSQSLPTTLDNLIADGRIPPVRAVLPSSGGRDARWSELGGEAGVEYVAEQLLPWVRARRGVDQGRAVVVGQSLGGLTALRLALGHPDRFTAVSQSASLWQDDLLALARRAPGARIHLGFGTQEWVLDPPHRALAEHLRTVGAEVEAAAYNGGHDYAWWRGAVADGLAWMLAG